MSIKMGFAKHVVDSHKSGGHQGIKAKTFLDTTEKTFETPYLSNE